MVLSRVFDIYLLIATVVDLSLILMTAAAPQLKLVNVIFRHGDRTPDSNGREMYPNDPYVNYSFYPTGLGQLTLEGKKREYRLGKNLRHIYSEFLGNVYLSRELVARSTDYDRTKMSLQLVLAGLFPPADVQRWNNRLDWQPIPSSYLPRVDDNILLSDECPGFIEEFDRINTLPEVQSRLAQFGEVMSNLTELTGKNITTVNDLFYLYHSFVAESSLGLPLPEWAYSYFPYGKLFDAVVTTYNLNSYNDVLKRHYGGPLIRDMIDNMIAAQNSINAPPTKIYLYSGHESNIAALLHAFNVYEPHVPEYSSAIILELHQIGTEYYVKLLYYLGIPPTVRELKIPDCDVLCPFDQFLELMSEVLPSDEELICDKRQTPDYANVEYPAAIQRVIYSLVRSSTTRKNNRL